MIAPLIVVLIKTLRWLETTKMLGSMKCARTLDGCWTFHLSWIKSGLLSVLL